jgi:hypothetical protein
MTLLTAGLLMCACGDDEEEVDYPECTVPEQLVLEGTLDGELINLRLDSEGHSFLNFGSEGSFEVFVPSSGTAPYEVAVRLDFENLLRRGGQVPARGVIELPEEGIIAGNCADDGLTGYISQSDDGNTTRFVLRSLKAEPYCGGAARSGELRGCFLFDES